MQDKTRKKIKENVTIVERSDIWQVSAAKRRKIRMKHKGPLKNKHYKEAKMKVMKNLKLYNYLRPLNH